MKLTLPFLKRRALPRKRFVLPGLPGTTLIVLAVWLLSLTPLLGPWDDLIYDYAIKALPVRETAQHQVVLVETAPDSAAVPAPLLKTLFAAGAVQVAALQPISEAEALDSDELARLTRARPLARATLVDGELPLAPGEVPAPLPASGSAMLVEQGSKTRIGGREHLNLEAEIARRLGRQELPERYRLNFHQGRQIPRLLAGQASSAAAIEHIVRGKVVLVGPGAGPFSAELMIPGRRDDGQATRLEFHALALDTLLQHREVRQLGPLVKLVVLLLLAAALRLALQPLQLGWGAVAAGIVLTALLALSAVLLRTADLWLPAQAFSLLVPGVFFAVYHAKVRQRSRRISSLLAAMEAKLHHRFVPKSVRESDQHWTYLSKLVDQTLPFDRAVFLERTGGEHRVTKVAAMNCSLDAIEEHERNYDRPPYTLAIAARGAVRLNEPQPFLSPGKRPEKQFLAPLLSAGEILGFWAIAVSPERIDHEDDFLKSVNAMAAQVAGLLAQRQRWLKRQRPVRQAFARFVQDETTNRLNALQTAIAALDRRTRSLERIFSGITTAAVLYDLFGRVVLLNDRMAELASGNELRPYERTANELIAALTGKSPEETRQTMIGMLHTGAGRHFQITLAKPAPTDFLLNITPLPSRAEDREDSEDSEFGASGEDSDHPFGFHGVLLELVDLREINRGLELKLHLIDFVAQQNAEDLARLQSTQQRLYLDLDQKNPAHEVASELHGQLVAVGERLEKLLGLLSQSVGTGEAGTYPMAPEPVLKLVKAQLSASSAKKSLRWALPATSSRTLCRANPADLTKLVAACCERLIDDASSDSTLVIELRIADQAITLLFANQGVGMPPQRLAGILAEPKRSAPPEWQALRDAVQRSRAWHAEFHAQTELGSGLRFSVRLPRVH